MEFHTKMDWINTTYKRMKKEEASNHKVGDRVVLRELSTPHMEDYMTLGDQYLIIGLYNSATGPGFIIKDDNSLERRLFYRWFAPSNSTNSEELI